MLESIIKFFSSLFIYGFCCDFGKNKLGNYIWLKIKDLVIKNDETKGIILESLSLGIENLQDTPDVNKNFMEASYILEKFSVLISEDYVNNLIENDEELKHFGVTDLKVNFASGSLSIHGVYRKGLSFPFAVDLKFTPRGKVLIVDFDRFWAADAIPMPQFFQSSLLSFIKNYLKSKEILAGAVHIDGRLIYLDICALSPVDCYIDLQNISVSEHYLVFQGGIDKEKCMQTIEQNLKIKDKKD